MHPNQSSGFTVLIKAFPAGHISERKDGRYQKQADGEWKKVSDPKLNRSTPEESGPKKAQPGKPTQPKEGEIYSIPEGGVMYGFDVKIGDTNKDGTYLSPAGGGSGVRVPVDSVKHFINDLSGVVEAYKDSGNSDVDKVIAGKGKLLGKGDDGIVFKVGDNVVKVSTTVPYQPFNRGHRTPEQAKDMLTDQVDTSEDMRKKGVPGILPSTLVRHGNKAFQVKPHVEIPDKLSKEELDKVKVMLEAMHEKGYTMNDQIQVGKHKGELYFFDTGKASHAPGSDKSDDMEELAFFYEKNGHKMSRGKRQDIEDQMMDLALPMDLGKTIEESGGVEEYKEKLKRAYMLVRGFLKAGYDMGFFSKDSIEDEYKGALADLEDHISTSKGFTVFVKGKAHPAGHISQRRDGQYQKQGDGSWKKIKSPAVSESQPEEKTPVRTRSEIDRDLGQLYNYLDYVKREGSWNKDVGMVQDKLIALMMERPEEREFDEKLSGLFGEAEVALGKPIPDDLGHPKWQKPKKVATGDSVRTIEDLQRLPLHTKIKMVDRGYPNKPKISHWVIQSNNTVKRIRSSDVAQTFDGFLLNEVSEGETEQTVSRVGSGLHRSDILKEYDRLYENSEKRGHRAKIKAPQNEWSAEQKRIVNAVTLFTAGHVNSVRNPKKYDKDKAQDDDIHGPLVKKKHGSSEENYEAMTARRHYWDAHDTCVALSNAKFDENRRVYRGMNLSYNSYTALKEGESFDLSPVSSWSFDHDIADRFKSNRPGGIIFEITSPRRGSDISTLSRYPRENEFITGGTVKVKEIKKKEDSGGVEYLHVVVEQHLESEAVRKSKPSHIREIEGEILCPMRIPQIRSEADASYESSDESKGFAVFVKGKMPVGTIRQRKDGHYRKEASGKWVKVKDPAQSSSIEEETQPQPSALPEEEAPQATTSPEEETPQPKAPQEQELNDSTPQAEEEAPSFGFELEDEEPESTAKPIADLSRAKKEKAVRDGLKEAGLVTGTAGNYEITVMGHLAHVLGMDQYSKIKMDSLGDRSIGKLYAMLVERHSMDEIAESFKQRPVGEEEEVQIHGPAAETTAGRIGDTDWWMDYGWQKNPGWDGAWHDTTTDDPERYEKKGVLKASSHMLRLREMRKRGEIPGPVLETMALFAITSIQTAATKQEQIYPQITEWLNKPSEERNTDELLAIMRPLGLQNSRLKAYGKMSSAMGIIEDGMRKHPTDGPSFRDHVLGEMKKADLKGLGYAKISFIAELAGYSDVACIDARVIQHLAQVPSKVSGKLAARLSGNRSLYIEFEKALGRSQSYKESDPEEVRLGMAQWRMWDASGGSDTDHAVLWDSIAELTGNEQFAKALQEMFHGPLTAAALGFTYNVLGGSAPPFDMHPTIVGPYIRQRHHNKPVSKGYTVLVKALPAGHISQRKDGQYQKQGDGSWKKVKSNDSTPKQVETGQMGLFDKPAQSEDWESGYKKTLEDWHEGDASDESLKRAHDAYLKALAGSSDFEARELVEKRSSMMQETLLGLHSKAVVEDFSIAILNHAKRIFSMSDFEKAEQGVHRKAFEKNVGEYLRSCQGYHQAIFDAASLGQGNVEDSRTKLSESRQGLKKYIASPSGQFAYNFYDKLNPGQQPGKTFLDNIHRAETNASVAFRHITAFDYSNDIYQKLQSRFQQMDAETRSQKLSKMEAYFEKSHKTHQRALVEQTDSILEKNPQDLFEDHPWAEFFPTENTQTGWMRAKMFAAFEDFENKKEFEEYAEHCYDLAIENSNQAKDEYYTFIPVDLPDPEKWMQAKKKSSDLQKQWEGSSTEKIKEHLNHEYGFQLNTGSQENAASLMHEMEMLRVTSGVRLRPVFDEAKEGATIELSVRQSLGTSMKGVGEVGGLFNTMFNEIHVLESPFAFAHELFHAIDWNIGEKTTSLGFDFSSDTESTEVRPKTPMSEELGLFVNVLAKLVRPRINSNTAIKGDRKEYFSKSPEIFARFGEQYIAMKSAQAVGSGDATDFTNLSKHPSAYEKRKTDLGSSPEYLDGPELMAFAELFESLGAGKKIMEMMSKAISWFSPVPSGFSVMVKAKGYPEGMVRQRKGGSYRKTGKKWVKIHEAEAPNASPKDKLEYLKQAYVRDREHFRRSTGAFSPKWNTIYDHIKEPDYRAFVEDLYTKFQTKNKQTSAEILKEKEKLQKDKAYESQGVTVDPSDPPSITDLHGKQVWLYHGTTSNFVKDIHEEGMVSGKNVSNAGETRDMVFLTADDSAGGGTADFYANQASRKHGGIPTVVRVLVNGSDLKYDPDDAGLSSGRYQYIVPKIHPEQVMEVNGKKTEHAKGKTS